MVGTPLRTHGRAIGALVVYRNVLRPFQPAELQLLQSFADQAVIAIENARLLNDLRQRTDDLSESLDQQTATSDVLQVISSSPGDLQPVFASMLENAVRICGATFGNIYRFDDGALRLAASCNVPPAFAEARRQTPHRHGAKTVSGRMLDTKSVIHLADAREQEAYIVDRDPGVVAAVELGGVRTLLAVPLLKDDELIGSFTLYREEVRPFTDKQVALITNFASQAVIAIENARLLGELRESLEQQTATADVLRVISSSPGDLKPVFAKMLESAARICEANFGSLALREGDAFRRVVLHNAPSEFLAFNERSPLFDVSVFPPLAEIARGKDAVHIADLEAEGPDNPLVRYGGARTLLVVPLRKAGEITGIFGIYRQELRPFSDKQIELLRSFAAQAVIAIENARLLSELRESLEQQTATAEVLGVISSSPGELQPVFQTMLDNATRLCGAPFGTMLLRDGDVLRLVARVVPPGTTAALFEIGSELVIAEHGNHPLVHMLSSPEILYIPDMRNTPAYQQRNPRVVAFVESIGARSVLRVPLVKDGECIGGFVIFRQELSVFSEKQTALMQSFAAQAVIAIENARLLSELRESLEQQTATAEVLGVISSSPGELQPVFDSALENATRLCGANFGALNLAENDAFRVAALYNMPALFEERFRRQPVFRPGPSTPLARAVARKDVVHVVDLTLDVAYTERDPVVTAVVEEGGVRCLLIVPMIKDGEFVGSFNIFRREPRAFTPKQIELVKNFAAQAVIAIENTRLLSELRESLEQQTATSEVLRVISSSPGDLKPVFDVMLTNATRLCQANFGNLFLYEDGALRTGALYNAPRGFAELRRREPVFKPGPLNPLSRLMATKAAIHVRDLRDDAAYKASEPDAVAFIDGSGVRTLLIVPMLKEGQLIGIMGVYRQEIREFTDKQIDLLTNFAAQAVIAIENTRLLTELRQRTDDLTESLEQQTAMSEVLQVISSSPGDLQPVFASILGNATRICQANFANLILPEDGAFRTVAMHNAPESLAQMRGRDPVFRLGPLAPLSRTATTKQVLHVHDLSADPSYQEGDPGAVRFVDAAHVRTILIVPMLKEEQFIGAIVIFRQEVRPFTDKQIALVTSFAAQAVIAIENARLLTELRQSLEQQTATADVLRVISSSPGELEPVFAAMLENATRICEANFGLLGLYEDGEFRRSAAMHNVPEAFAELRLRQGAVHYGPKHPLVRLAATKQVQHIADVRTDAAYLDGDVALGQLAELARARTLLIVPMLKENDLLGAISVYRQEVHPFNDKQIELIKNFAAQAVIAIENTRLLTELRQRTDDLTESLEQQTATADVLRAISSSPGDLQPVFTAMLEIQVCRLCFGWGLL